MAKHILKLEEWQGASGSWYCGAIKEIGKIGNLWYTIPRALNLSLTDYIERLIKQFKPDRISFHDSEQGGVLVYSWKSQTAMRKYKNFINAELRKAQFYVD